MSVTWRGTAVAGSGVAVVDGGDMADVVCPHPSMRGGAAGVTWRMRRASTRGDVAVVGVGDVAVARGWCQ